MAFDQPTRNRLNNFVSKARTLLTEEFARQLQSDYGIDPATGRIDDVAGIVHLNDRQRETARILRDTLHHYTAGKGDQKGRDDKKTRIAAIDRIVREQAFTVLNRLAALRMAEARGLLIPSIAEGVRSDGFQLYQQLAGVALGEIDEAYIAYLFSLFDEFAVDLPVLFDRFSPEGRLFPSVRVLRQLLALVNDEEIDSLWAEDETIGWIYQYFNSSEERRQMRQASQAPRNSRELAVRNQFFTPRYVVEFLTDNTLGRIWYEMTKGQTRLVDQCRYMVRRPHEVFLAPGETAPEQERDDDFTQEELLNQPVYIPHRPLKDPRDIKMLDPACGSMHFGLYAFDLFEAIYEEAWEMGVLGTWARDYQDKAVFVREVPRLIIEHNIHGIDIDARAVQIAGISLWFRAQRSWQAQGVRFVNRPAITHSNVVVAEPMPGEEEELEAFLGAQFEDTIQDQIVAGLVRRVFDSMKLAGEAGSLLKIEDAIAGDVAAAKDKWTTAPKLRQGSLFERPEEIALSLEASVLSDEQFWGQIESRIYLALKEFAEHAAQDDSFRRRLFANDAAQGFAFIDLCRHKYDVLVMNPPFGEAALGTKTYVKRHYPNSSADIFQAFVERSLQSLAASGRVGVISARTGFFLGNSSSWREHVVFSNTLAYFVDLGLGVLDDALVEVAVYVIERTRAEGNYVLTNRQLETREKRDGLRAAVEGTLTCQENAFLPFRQALVLAIPDLTFAYWAPERFLRRYSSETSFGAMVSNVRQGVATADDFRFARLGWEVANTAIGRDKRWKRFSKGGEYSPPYDDIHLLIDWGNNGSQLRAFPRSFIRNDSFYYKPGATYTVRTASAFAGKVLPADCVFSHNAQSWFAPSLETGFLSIGYLTCRVPQAFIELSVGGGDVATSGSAARRYTTAVVEGIPAKPLYDLSLRENQRWMHTYFAFRLRQFSADETSCHFAIFHLPEEGTNIAEAVRRENMEYLSAATDALLATHKLDSSVTGAFRLSQRELEFVASEIGVHPGSYDGTADTRELERLLQLSEEQIIAEAVKLHGAKRWFTKKSYFVDRKLELICHHRRVSPSYMQSRLETIDLSFGGADYVRSMLSEAVGCAFGRWDIRYATGQKEPPPLPDPFDPLPACPPGMLQNADGLPARPEDAPVDYPLRISWSGILVDDDGHREDIVGRVREALHVIWEEKADDIEAEACSLLGVDSMRDYFGNPNRFFDDHLSRYSKSRRYAPIYWPLTTTNGGYTLWLYYHRVDAGTLYQCLNDFVDPKLKDVQRRLNGLRNRQRTSEDERKLEQLTDLVVELETFRTDLLELARFWRPNLNDGVEITATPLYALFGNTKWRNRLEGTWGKLQEGEYDWAHLAMSIWPSRVVPKCVEDRSLAIAHDIEKLFWVEEDESWRPLGSPAEEEAHQVDIRHSEERDRLRELFAELAEGEGRYLPAMQVWQSLDEGEWDHRPLGLHLYPERAAEAAFDDATRVYAHLAQRGQKLLQKDTKKNRQLLAKLLVERATPELVAAVEATLAEEPADFATLWQELEKGRRDDLPLALALWPERVVSKALRDPELALQHGLFDFFWYDEPGTGVRRRQPVDREIAHEVQRRGGDRLN